MKKKKLIEKVILNPPKPLREEADGAESKDDGIWTADVWRLDEVNLNGRIYTTELAQRIVKESPVTTANDGHDADWHQEYGNAKAVCKEPWIEDGCLKVKIKFIDEAYEQKLLALAAEGISIGVSSVGWGEMDDSGRIVPETYELVRFLDFVENPAGQVYAKKESCEEGDEPEVSALVTPAMAADLAKNITRIRFRRISK